MKEFDWQKMLDNGIITQSHLNKGFDQVSVVESSADRPNYPPEFDTAYDLPRLPERPPTFMRPYSRVTTLLVVGLAALILALWMLGTPFSVMGKVDAVGYAICHRISERSFHVHGHALPLCARCTGIYLGVATGLVVFGASGRIRSSRLPNWTIMVLMSLTALGIAADGINSYLTLFPFYHPIYEPRNAFRLITGMYAGLTMISVVLPVFNSTAWFVPEPSAPLQSWKELIGLWLIGALVCAAVLIQVPALLLIFGLISSAAVVLLFVLIGAVLFMTLLRRDGAALRFHDLWIPLLAGLAFAFLLIGSIDVARYLLTGTWDGFVPLE